MREAFNKESVNDEDVEVREHVTSEAPAFCMDLQRVLHTFILIHPSDLLYRANLLSLLLLKKSEAKGR